MNSKRTNDMKTFLPLRNLKTTVVLSLLFYLLFTTGNVHGQCEIQITNCPDDVTAVCADSINDENGDVGKFISWTTPDFNLVDCDGDPSGDNTFFVSFDLNARQLSEECWTLEGVTRHGSGYLKLFNSGDATYVITPFVYIEGEESVSIDIEFNANDNYDVELWLIDETGNMLSDSAGSHVLNFQNDSTLTLEFTTNNLQSGIYRLKFNFNGDGANSNRADNISFDGIVINTECTSDIDFVVSGPAPDFFVIGDTSLTYTATYTPIDGDPVTTSCSFDIIIDGVTVDLPLATTPESCTGNDGTITILANSPTSNDPNKNREMSLLCQDET